MILGNKTKHETVHVLPDSIVVLIHLTLGEQLFWIITGFSIEFDYLTTLKELLDFTFKNVPDQIILLGLGDDSEGVHLTFLIIKYQVKNRLHGVFSNFISDVKMSTNDSELSSYSE